MSEKEKTLVILKDSIDNFISLNLSKTFKNNSFDIVTNKIMTNNYVLTTISKLIDSYKKLINYENNRVNSKLILSCYLIKYFTNDVLSSQLEDKEIILFEKSKEFVNYLDNLNKDEFIKDFETFIKKINTYGLIFYNWKNKDLKSQIDIYCEIYYSYQKDINKLKEDEINNIDFINNLENIKLIVKDSLKNLVGKSEVDNTINNYKYIEKLYDNSLYNIVKKNLKNVYWKNIYNDLQNDPKIYLQIESIIIEVNKYLDIIYNNKTKNLNKYLDVNFIKNLIKDNEINENNVIFICSNLLDELQKHDSKEFDIKILELKKNLDCVSEDKEFVDISINVLSYCLNRLEWLANTIIKINEVKF